MSDKGYDPTKYVVIKGEDWETYQQVMEITHGDQMPDALDPESYFVLRRGDIAGHFGLAAWLEAITFLANLESLTPGERDHLISLSDDVHDFLHDWRKDYLNQSTRLPD